MSEDYWRDLLINYGWAYNKAEFFGTLKHRIKEGDLGETETTLDFCKRKVKEYYEAIYGTEWSGLDE